MKTTELFRAVCCGVLLLFSSGCANRLFFATKTSIGLEVSGTSQMPDKVSFSSSRYEGAIVPRASSGEPYSVYGALDADVQWFPPDYVIRQIFATGEAARIAAREEEEETQAKPLDTNRTYSTKPLFFVTDTTFGLKLSAGKQDVSPTVVVGYRRIEGTVIPVEKWETEARSVYADIVINSSTNNTGLATNYPASNGVRIHQSFATGRAAEYTAQKPHIKRKLRAAVDPEQVEQVRTETRQAMKASESVARFVWADAGSVDVRKQRLTQAFQGVKLGDDTLDRRNRTINSYATLPDQESLKSRLENAFTPAQLDLMLSNINP